MFRKKSVKGDPHTEYPCTIRFLDDSEPIQLTFKKETPGQILYDQVCSKLNLVEKDYFGLRYVDPEKQRHWLDPLKSAYKQMKGVNPPVLCFRVKFYPSEPMKLHEEITRYYMFLQLRRDLHHGRLLCSQTDANLLAAYIVQSEVGDYDVEDHPIGYVSEFKMLPKQNPKMEEEIMKNHKTLVGQVPAEAEANFLRKACTLDTYGVDPHQVKDQKGTQLYLGVTHQGIMTFHGSRRTQLFKWGQIRRIAYEGKMFIVHVNVAEKQQPIGYKCQTVAACKYLWRCAVEQQLFFTLQNSSNPPKVRSGGSLFARGSKYRFSGRCQNEAYQASDSIKRDEPNFARSSSLPNFARRVDGKHPMKNMSLHIEPVKEDKKKYNENPVDVPGHSSVAASKVEILQKGPHVHAPLASQEEVIIEDIKPQSTATVETSAPCKENGGIPTLVIGDSFELSQAYEPEISVLETGGDISPKPSLDDQIKELEEQWDRIKSEPNHVSPLESTPAKPQNAANKTESGNPSGALKKPAGISCCRILLYTFFFVFLTLTVLTVVLLNSNIEHPLVTELHEHFAFVIPVRDYIQDRVHSVFQS
ncbi:hypothetical protein ScPMuIL_018425 [Solemya velum]